ncbi:transport and Golgi organization protein 2 [Lutibacter oceani]|uniref:Transport and Golgi organization protein 2 n=1 Tax=Lutibacter oceani TaxID=1853311 RepID=A0A3D9S318_9FLAO|nr:NRDE family protein [Lutibacter oceani]REE83265.1 transport and Golgi organization protein 2 [Lutibacter oceani]
MCTVTFLPLKNNNFILTSNRDETPLRETLPPKEYLENGIKMVFPKDKLAGGTWIGTSSKNRLVCVLNGAFIKHTRKTNYKKSRGLIAKEILQTTNFQEYIKDLELEGIEPFTMVIVDWNENNLNLFELIWDENQKRFNRLQNEPKIWSSATLYSDEIKALRKKWFKNWIKKNDFNSSNILQFHHSEIGDKEQAVFMKRPFVETVSITSIKKENKTIEMLYEDVIHSKKLLLTI